MKRILQILLLVAILVLGYVMYRQLATPLEFAKERTAREGAVIERLKDIRVAERAYRTKYGHFTGSFDSLTQFVLTGELPFERKLVDENDSVAMAALKKSGRKNTEVVMVPVLDTIFSPRRLTADQVRDLRYIPGTDRRTQFDIAAGQLQTESKVVIPVVRVRAAYKQFLDTVKYRNQVVSLIDDQVRNYGNWGGLEFGSLEKGNNEAGNWGDE